MSEETFLAPFKRCDDKLGLVHGQLDNLADALRYTGNAGLAGKLDGLASVIKSAREDLVLARETALMTWVGSVERGSANMINAVIAAVSK